MRGCLCGRALNFDGSLVEDNETVPTLRNRVLVALFRTLEDKVDKVGWGSGNDWASHAKNVASYDLSLHTLSIVVQWNQI